MLNSKWTVAFEAHKQTFIFRIQTRESFFRRASPPSSTERHSAAPFAVRNISLSLHPRALSSFSPFLQKTLFSFSSSRPLAIIISRGRGVWEREPGVSLLVLQFFSFRVRATISHKHWVIKKRTDLFKNRGWSLRALLPYAVPHDSK